MPEPPRPTPSRLAGGGNGRIQIFDQVGDFIDQWFQCGRMGGICIDVNDILYAPVLRPPLCPPAKV